MIFHLRQVLGDLFPEFKDALARIQIDTLDNLIAGMSEADAQRFLIMVGFTGTCADIIDASGLPFKWPLPGELPPKEWVKTVFSHYMVEGDGGIWKEAERVIIDLMTPSGPKEVWPEEMLSKADANDPNS